MSEFDEPDVELPSRGDDRPGLADLEDDEYPGVESDEGDDDYPEDATEEDVDLVVALYREDGQPVAVALAPDLANDLDELIDLLRRMPGDGGAAAVVSIASEFFVLVRVRGRHVQVFLSDVVASGDWPIARDVADFLGVELPYEDEDHPFPVGDLDIFADSGLPVFELEAIAAQYDEDSAVLAGQVADRVKFGPQFAKAVAAAFG